jgi:hypothetical protein
MPNFLPASGRGSARKLRRVCCALCRAAGHRLTAKRSRAALAVAERYAGGLADVSALPTAHGVVARVSTYTDEYAWTADKQGMFRAANAVGRATGQREPPAPPGYLAGCAAAGAKAAAVTEGRSAAEVHARQSALLRDIRGPRPFRPVTVPLPSSPGRVAR